MNEVVTELVNGKALAALQEHGGDIGPKLENIEAMTMAKPNPAHDSNKQ